MHYLPKVGMDDNDAPTIITQLLLISTVEAAAQTFVMNNSILPEKPFRFRNEDRS